MRRHVRILFLLVLVISTLFFKSDIFTIQKTYIKKNVSVKLEMSGNEETILEINDKYEEPNIVFKVNNKDGIVKKNGFIDISRVGEYELKYNFYLSEFKLDTKVRKIKVVDTKRPLITLKGSTNYKVAQNSKYNDPGFTVIDNSKEDLIKLVKIEGKVDTKKAGTYKVKHSVTDSSGNKTEVIRNVIVQVATSTKSMKVTRVSQVEKGTETTSKVSLTSDVNTTTSMSFTSSGVNITGYVKTPNSKYTVKLCNESNTCTSTNMTVKKTNYYTGNLKLTNLSNGTYSMKVVGKTEMDIVNKLDTFDRIYRSKVGEKLVTITYSSNKPKIKIENFKYQYDILIDPGHGGSDSGAVNSSITEKLLNLEQSKYEKSRYEQHGLKVLLIRSDDSYGLMMGSSNETRVRRRAYAIGYYGSVSKISYSNHHNSIDNNYFSGWEIISAAKLTSSQLSPELKIANDWDEEYPTTDIHTRFYTRNYDTGSILNKRNGQTYNVKNYYAVIRIPYELFNVKNTLFEGCYLSNSNDFKWYYKEKNWKKLSEIKIKHYVESLGITYVP